MVRVISQPRLWLCAKGSCWKCGFHGDWAYVVLTVELPCLYLMPASAHPPCYARPLLCLSCSPALCSCHFHMSSCCFGVYWFLWSFTLPFFHLYSCDTLIPLQGSSFYCPCHYGFAVVVYCTSLHHGGGIQEHVALCVCVFSPTYHKLGLLLSWVMTALFNSSLQYSLMHSYSTSKGTVINYKWFN